MNDISSQQVIRSNEQSTEIPFPIKPNSMVSLSPSASYPAVYPFSSILYSSLFLHPKLRMMVFWLILSIHQLKKVIILY